MDNGCHKTDSGKKHSLYFDFQREKIEHYHIEASHVYNMDEKGFMLGVIGRSKRIFSKASYEYEKRRSTVGWRPSNPWRRK
jgi:hypothetical protein